MRNSDRIVYFVIFSTVVAVGVFFRFWNMPKMAHFHGDQGIDLLVSQRIVKGEFYPHVGPILSVNNFYNPPTYYYFLGLLLKLFSSEVAVIYIFGILNILSGVLYASVVKSKTDAPTAITFLFLYAVLFSSVEQGRTLWNPYAATPFLAAGMWLFLYPTKQYSMRRYALSVIVTIIGITMYPTGFLLIPAYMFYGFQFLQNVYEDRFRIFMINCVFFFSTLLIVSSPFVLFEYQHNFPTIHAITIHDESKSSNVSFVYYDNATSVLKRASRFVKGVYNLYIPKYSQGKFVRLNIKVITLVLLGSSMVMLSYFQKKNRWLLLKNKFAPFGYQYVIPIVLAYIFVDSIIYTYRVLIFLPFSLFLLSYVVHKVTVHNNWITRCATGIFFMLIIYVNITSNIADASNYGDARRYGNLLNLYAQLNREAQNKGLKFVNVGLRVITKNDFVNWEVTPLWYLMKKYTNYPAPMSEVGIDSLRSSTIDESQNYAYVICYPDQVDCWDTFVAENPYASIVHERVIGSYYVYFVRKGRNTWSDIQ